MELTCGYAILAAIGAVALFFTWANRATAKAHAHFRTEDVEAALHEFVSPDSKYHDGWDLFLSWPIDNPSLESVRQDCLKLVRESPYSPPELDPEIVPKVARLLEHLRNDT
jgi:hypothetical protein